MIRLGNFAVVALLCCISAVAQDGGYWKPASKTASAITGDIGISAERLSINFATFTIADIRALTPEESTTLFNIESGDGGSGKLYRLNIPAGKTFLHRNTLCGGEDTQWLATYARRKTLQTAFLSGSKMPVFTPDALSTSTALCGTFSYTR